MKKIFIISFVFFIAVLAEAQVGAGRTMFVMTKTVQLKASTARLAGTVATLNYGDQITVVQVDGKFAEVVSVENPALSGWSALDNFTTKKIIAGNTATASAKEIALAGKGFNQEVENSYRSNGELNYTDVDKMESFTIDDDDLLRFLEAGFLTSGN